MVTKCLTGQPNVNMAGRLPSPLGRHCDGYLQNRLPADRLRCERTSRDGSRGQVYGNQLFQGWRQFRALGACALDVAYVACGRLDAFADPIGLHGLWDYAAAHLIALEAGAHSGEVTVRDLLHTDHAARRAPVYGATPELVRQLVDQLGGLSEHGQPI